MRALGRHLRVALATTASAVALGTSTVAWATPITFAFSGEVTNSALGIAIGTSVSGLYTFDSSPTDALPGDATEGRYFSTATESGWYVQVGGSVLTTQPYSGSRVSTQVFDDHDVNGTSFDGYIASGFGLAGELGSNLVISIGNILEPTSIFASDSLLSTPPSLSGAVGTIYTGPYTPIVNFSVSLPLTLSAAPFPGAIVPPADGGGSLGGGGTSPIAIDSSACDGIWDSEARLLCLVNDVRIRSGLGTLLIDLALNEAANLHTLDMYDSQFLSHTGSDGSQFSTRALDTGYDGTPFGELIGSGFSLADTLVQAWLDSDLHRNVLLNKWVDEAGIGYVEGSNGSYWDLLLGRSPAGAVPSPGTLPLLGIALCALAIARRNMHSCCP